MELQLLHDQAMQNIFNGPLCPKFHHAITQIVNIKGEIQ